MREVRGSVFVDYVRMMRGNHDCDWNAHLLPEDLPFLAQDVLPNNWYPMDTFERMGNAILKELVQSNLQAVRAWGRASVAPLLAQYPDLAKVGDAMETMARFMIMRKTLFNYDVFSFKELVPVQAVVAISFQMGNTAEEAASYQTLGFFESVLETAGAKDVSAAFETKSWAGDALTLVNLSWAN